MSDRDEFESILDEMLRLAETIAGGAGPRRTDAVTVQSRPDELIEGRERLTYILNAPGYEKDELRVSVLEDALEVKGPDFLVRKRLPGGVNPETAKSRYLNGVLSVTMERKR